MNPCSPHMVVEYFPISPSPFIPTACSSLTPDFLTHVSVLGTESTTTGLRPQLMIGKVRTYLESICRSVCPLHLTSAHSREIPVWQIRRGGDVSVCPIGCVTLGRSFSFPGSPFRRYN